MDSLPSSSFSPVMYNNYGVLPLPVPRCPPSRQDWENYRGTFTQLYQIEDRPLKAVKELMEQRYGFKATERMYKKKINEWKVKKNYSREEKDAVLRAVERRRQAGKADHEVLIRGRPVEVDRILRYIKSVAKGSGVQSSGGPSMFTADDRVEVRTPNAECFVDNECTLPQLQVDLLRRLSLSPGPGRPMFLRHDLGKAELLCWESVGYFQTVLIDPLRPQGIVDLDYRGSRSPSSKVSRGPGGIPQIHVFFPAIPRDPVSIVSFISQAIRHANAGRFNDARVLVNDASELLKNALRGGLPTRLLPALLGAVYYSCDEKTPFKVPQLFHKHTIQLCEAFLGVRHPITMVMRMFCEVDNKAQVFNAILEGLLDAVLAKADFDAIDEVPVYIIQRRGFSREKIGRDDEAERVFKNALVTQKIIRRLAWLSVEVNGNYFLAENTFERVLRRSGSEAGKVTDPRVRKNALDVLAGIAIMEELLRRDHDWGGGQHSFENMGPRAEEPPRVFYIEAPPDLLCISLFPA